MDNYPTVILAGGPTPEKILEAGEPEKERAFIKINGRPMVSWVIDAVKACKRTSDLLVIGNVDRLNAEVGLDKSVLMSDKGSMFENFIAAMERFRSSNLVLSGTCDIPLITGPILDDLIGQIDTIDAEVYYPIVNVKYFDEKFPGGHRTTQKLKEGTFTGGNIFALAPEAVLKNRFRMEAVIRDRKSPAKLVKLFGPMFVMRFLAQQLDLKALEAKATEILGARMRGVLTTHPEIGFDVDKPSDLNIVRGLMKNP